MRIAYLVHWNEPRTSGVFKKMQGHLRKWRAEGHAVHLFVITKDPTALMSAQEGETIVPFAGGRDRLRAWERMHDAIHAWNPDLVYHRYDIYTPGLRRILRHFKTVIEVNADDTMEFKSNGRSRHYYNLATRRWIFGLARGLVFVTGELSRSSAFAAFTSRRIVLGNGIDLADNPTLPAATPERRELVFIGTAGQTWHGTDKVVELARLLPDWHVHIIGPGLGNLGTDLPVNVTVHGFLGKEQYLGIFEGCTAGIGSLAMHRIGMNEASPLKVREYVARGLPVILGYTDTDLSGQDFMLELGNCEDNVRNGAERIREFLAQWSGRRVTPEQAPAIDNPRKELERLTFLQTVVDHG